MSGFQHHRRSSDAVGPTALADFLDAMPPREIRCLTGLDPAEFAECLALDLPPARPVLLFEPGELRSAAEIIESFTAQLARAVAQLWPFLWDGEDLAALRDDAVGRAHLPIRIAALARRVPHLSQAWACEIVPRLLRRLSPRMRSAGREVDWEQLALAFAPDGFIVATELAGPTFREAQIRALEWLAEHANVAILVLAPTIGADASIARILFGARQWEGGRAPTDEPSPTVTPAPTTAAMVALQAPIVLALPKTEGRPHPQSACELKIYTLVQADEELRPLFIFNKSVPDLGLLHARADILWPAGRLVVEIDGPEHRSAAKYRADRDRDYRLLLAGYRVLRVTNEDIEADAALALEKIRDVVRLAEQEGP